MNVLAGESRGRQETPADFGTRFESWMENFAPDTLAPVSILGWTAGVSAFRIVRAATLARLLGKTCTARAVAGLAGLAAEATAFSLGGRIGDRSWEQLPADFAGNILLLGAMRFMTQLGSGVRGAGILRQGGMLAGFSLGRELQIAAGLHRRAESSTPFFDSFTMLVQANVGGAWARSLLGPRIRAWEIGWELRGRLISTPKTSGNFFPESVSWAAGPSHLAPRRPPGEITSWSAAMRPQGRSGGDKESIYQKFRPRFPIDGPDIYSEHVLRAALSIPFPLEPFSERFLEGLVRSTQAGSFRQASFVEGVKRIFQLNPLRSATGSFEEALQQSLLENLLAENFAVRRGLQWDALLPDFETGLPRAKTTRWLRKFAWDAALGMSTAMEYLPQFLKPHEKFLQEEMKSYSGLHRILILNFIHRHEPNDPARARKMMAVFAEARRGANYPAEAVDRVLEYARTSPFGHLAVRRLFHVLTAGDVAAKLREIPEDPDTGETSALIQNWQALGRSAERMAHDLAGTRHTAYLDDPRLARKVLSVYLDINRFPQAAASSRRRWIRLDQTIFSFVNSRRRPDASDLIELLETNLNPEMRSLARSWEEGRFRIEFLPDAVFDGLVGQWGQAKAGHAVFLAPDRILLRDWPPDFLRGGDPEADFQEIMERLKALVHEWEHWRHGSGRFEGVEKGGGPVELANPGRRERLVSEMMAHFEQYRWSFKNFDDDFGAVSTRLGQTPAMFFRGLADEAYFGTASRAAAASWLKRD